MLIQVFCLSLNNLRFKIHCLFYIENEYILFLIGYDRSKLYKTSKLKMNFLIYINIIAINT